MRYINSNSFCIASLEPPPLKSPLYSTALSHAKSIIFFRVIIPPFSYSIKKKTFRSFFNIINKIKKPIAAFNISSSIGFNLGLLPRRIPYYFLIAFILY